MLLARLTEANASMAGQIRELTAPERPLNGPQSDSGGGGLTSTPRAHTDAQEATQAPEGLDKQTDQTRRPWWARWFGG